MASVDGKRATNLATYATTTPVVAFHPGVVMLSSGTSSERRKLLDRVALYRAPASLGIAAVYARATRARQRLLEAGGEVGKRLDFLLQELNRETNTILSKTSGAGEVGLD